ncbi:MAG: ABC transporter ATP-binding protein [Patescibacteria group bacterium]
MSRLILRDLRKTFGTKVAVEHITIETKEGEMVVFVGPSGCGKTTTLRLIAGLELPTGGEIFFDNRPVTHLRPRDRNVAMVFQDYAVFPHFTVFENIAYGLRSRHVPHDEIRKKVMAAAKTFRIDNLLDRKPGKISGGERQRVALARAMVKDADIFLFDEPLSNLDAVLRSEARTDILRLHKASGKTAVYVTHDQTEAMTLGDRVAVMKDGAIVQLGTPHDLYATPMNMYVAHFIGTPGMNFLPCKVESGEGGFTLAVGLDRLAPPPGLDSVLQAHLGKDLVLGVRPEDFYLPGTSEVQGTPANTLNCVLNAVEASAGDSLLYLSAKDAKATDLVAVVKARVGDRYIGRAFPLLLDTKRLHLFEPESGRRCLVSRRTVA